MSQSQSQDLGGTSVAIVVAPEGTEHVEFEQPNERLSDAGADVDVISTESGEAQTVENDLEAAETVEVDEAIADVSPDDYDALVIPGGTVGADTIRADDEAVEFVAEHVADGKPTASICHGPWALVESGAVEGRTVTSYPSLQTDVENGGGEWVDEEVVTDGNLVTSRKPDDLDAFCDAFVDEVAAES